MMDNINKYIGLIEKMMGGIFWILCIFGVLLHSVPTCYSFSIFLDIHISICSY